MHLWGKKGSQVIQTNVQPNANIILSHIQSLDWYLQTAAEKNLVFYQPFKKKISSAKSTS